MWAGKHRRTPRLRRRSVQRQTCEAMKIKIGASMQETEPIRLPPNTGGKGKKRPDLDQFRGIEPVTNRSRGASS
ncbi:hypothetical protein PoB_006740800 [Plakobranchus ocellatus]|uniref:Uncharacterized protein n=1 Tax=Plakobranchus ocellatus TaxID=259542 RepID=A0AAV4D9H6_9GAST|nr:hypothetical protein PoB_006740800 [Plakobranchus ocellatus]